MNGRVNVNCTAQRRITHRFLAPVIVGLGLTMSGRALADQPSVQQCLEASDASLELETAGQLLATRTALRVCAAPSCPREIQAECARRVELMEQAIPTVACEVRDADGRLRPDARLSVDGAAPAIAANGSIELDPGTHRLVALVSGATASRNVSVSAGDRNLRVLITLDGSNASSPSQALPEPAPPSMAPRRVAALAVGGAGLASLGVASVFAIIALERKQDAESICPEHPCPSSGGAERWESACRAGNLSTAFAVVGGVALTAAAGLWLSVDAHSTTTIGLGPERLQLRTRF